MKTFIGDLQATNERMAQATQQFMADLAGNRQRMSDQQWSDMIRAEQERISQAIADQARRIEDLHILLD